jgi:tetratricopeptide (TPR) repeat protein
VRAVRRWHLILWAVVLAGVAWAAFVASTRRRADGLRQSADLACRRFDFAAAHAHLLAYLELHPEEAEAHLLAGRCARRAEFVEHYTGPNPGLFAMAPRHLAAAARHGGGPAAVALERTLGRAQHGDLPGAERSLVDRAKEGGPDAPLILEALTHGYLGQLQFEKALVCVESLLRLEPANVQALLWRGRIRGQVRQTRAAREDYESAVRLNPDFHPARYYLAESLLLSNRVDEAEAHLRVLNGRAADNLLVRLAWAKCRIAAGDGAAGQQLLDAWLTDAPKGHPRLLEALTARASLALAVGRLAEAEDFARRALLESPLDQHALHDLARSLNAQGRTRQAQGVQEQLDRVKQDLRNVARCREQLARAPDDLGLRHEIGTTYLRLGRPGEALVWLNSVLDRDPGHRPTLQALADYHSRAGNGAMATEMQRRLAAAR